MPKFRTEKEQFESAVVLMLTQGRDILFKRLEPLILQHKVLLENEDTSFHKEIESEFENLIKREISDEIAVSMQLDPEQIFTIVETMNVPEFLGSFDKNPIKKEEK